MQWRKIETAPKDGTSILLKFEDGITEGAWVEKIVRHLRDDRMVDLSKWEVTVLPSHGCGCCSSDNDPPTHWCPLPKE